MKSIAEKTKRIVRRMTTTRIREKRRRGRAIRGRREMGFDGKLTAHERRIVNDG